MWVPHPSFVCSGGVSYLYDGDGPGAPLIRGFRMSGPARRNTLSSTATPDNSLLPSPLHHKHTSGSCSIATLRVFPPDRASPGFRCINHPNDRKNGARRGPRSAQLLDALFRSAHIEVVETLLPDRAGAQAAGGAGLAPAEAGSGWMERRTQHSACGCVLG